MPSFVQSSARRACGCLLLLLFAAMLPGSVAAAAPVCGQADADTLSETARSVLLLNQALNTGGLGGVSARVSGAGTPGSGAGASVLKSRADLVRTLMQTHPDEVRSVMLPAAVAARLIAADPTSANLLEHDATAAGDLGAVEQDDFEHNASERVYLLHDAATAVQLAVHPTASLRLQALLHRSVTVSGIAIGSDMTAETITPSRATALPSREHSLALRADAVPASNSTLMCSTTGQQRTAVLMLQFPNNTPAFPGVYGTAAWWQQAIAGSNSSVNSLWSEMTAGGTYATVDVFGPLTLSQSYGCSDYLAMRSAALTLASSTIDLSRYTRIVLGFPASTCSFGGLADIGCNAADTIVPHPYSVVWLPILTTYTGPTGVWASLAHELGHNLGLNHANTLDFGAVSLGPIDFQATNPGTVGGTGATTAAGAITAVDTEYGDVFSVMGNPWSSGPGPYSAEHRAKLLDWVPANGLGTITAAGTYTIQPASLGNGLRALRVLRDPASSSWLWLEYRNGGTPYDAANLAAVRGQNVSQGAVVHYENGYGDHDKTFELDMTPSGRGNNFADGALTPGATWSDPYSPLSLTVNSITSAGLNVSVRYDSTCATFSMGSSAVAAEGGSGTILVTAPATCSWSAASNAAWMSLSGTTRGTGNGTFTWSAAANTGSGQRTTYVSVGRNSQRLLQLGTGASVVALAPANASVDPGSSIVLSLTVQSGNGIAGVQTVELDARAAGAPLCTVVVDLTSAATPFFFLLDPDTNEFTSAVRAGSGSQSTSACTLSGAGSGVTVNGSSITVAANLSFPSTSPGVRSLFASANYGAELPVGMLNVGTVTASQSTPPSNPPTSTLRATTVSLTGVPGSVVAGTSLALSAAITSGSGSGVPNGTVTFFDGANALGSAPLLSGSASITSPALANGTHTLTAVYSGDSTFATSTSAAATVVVAKATTSTSLTSSAPQVAAGGSVSLTVAVAHSAGPVAPSGTVTLRDGSTTVATALLSNGMASFPLTGVAAGTHTYTALYSGDASYLASASDAVLVTVTKFIPTLGVSGAATVLTGAPVRITVTATGGTGAGGALPGGTVLLQDGSQSLGSITLTVGTGMLSLGNLPAGSHSITAVYAGDAEFSAGVAGPMAMNVVDFSLAGSGTPNITVTAGATTGNTAALTLTPGSNGFPVAIALQCSGAPAGATCSVTPGAATPGNAAVPVVVRVMTTARTSSDYIGAMAATLGLPSFAFVLRRRRVSALRLLAVLFVSVAVGVGVTGCGAGISGTGTTTISPPSTSSPGTTGTPAGITTLTVQAVAVSNGATLTRTATVILQVN